MKDYNAQERYDRLNRPSRRASYERSALKCWKAEQERAERLVKSLALVQEERDTLQQENRELREALESALGVLEATPHTNLTDAFIADLRERFGLGGK